MSEEEEAEVDLHNLRKRVHTLVREINDMCHEYEYWSSSSPEEEDDEPSDPSPPTVSVKNCAKYMANKNFLVPWTKSCRRLLIHIRSGRNFWHKNEQRRTTFLSIRLHPQLPTVHSRICSDTLKPLYNFEHSFDVSGLSFDSIVPVIEVHDYITPNESQIYAVAYVSLQCAKEYEDRVKVFDQTWIPIVTPVSRILCGSLQCSLIFLKSKPKSSHEEEEAQPEPEPIATPEMKEREDVASQTIPPTSADAQTQTFGVFRENKDTVPGDLNDFLADIDEWGLTKPPILHRREVSATPRHISYCEGLLPESSYRKYKDFDWGSLS